MSVVEGGVVEENAVPGPAPEPVAIAIVFVDPDDVAAAVDDNPYPLFAIAYELFRGIITRAQKQNNVVSLAFSLISP